MIDIHCHILPAIDDGSANMKETKKMLSLAMQEGIHAIVATSHWEAGMGEEWMERYQKSFQSVQAYIQEEKLPITLYPGNEILHSERTHLYLVQNKLNSMNKTRYLLVEFPFHVSFSYIQRAVLNLSYHGYWPILAHIERYEALRDIRKVAELVDMGAYIQVNTSSVAGEHGWLMKRYCLQLMKLDLLHFVATDSHGSTNRPPKAKKALAVMEKKMGKEYTKMITEENPQKMIRGVRIGGED